MNNIDLKQHKTEKFLNLIRNVDSQDFWLKKMLKIASQVELQIETVPVEEKNDYCARVKAQLFILGRETVGYDFQAANTHVYSKNYKHLESLTQHLGLGKTLRSDNLTPMFYSLAPDDVKDLTPYILAELKKQDITLIDLAHDAVRVNKMKGLTSIGECADSFNVITQLVKLKMGEGEVLDTYKMEDLFNVLGKMTNAYNLNQYLTALVEGVKERSQIAIGIGEFENFLRSTRILNTAVMKELLEKLILKNNLTASFDKVSTAPVESENFEIFKKERVSSPNDIFPSNIVISLKDKNIDDLMKEISVVSVAAKQSMFRLKENFRKINTEINFLESKKERLSVESQTECRVNFKQNVPHILSFIRSIPELSLPNKEKSVLMMVENTNYLVQQLSDYRQEVESVMMKDLSAMNRHQAQKTMTMSK